MGDSIRKPLQRCRMVEVEPEGAEIDAVWQLRFRHHFEELEKERASLSSRDKLQELSPSDAVIFSALVADNIRPWKPNQLSNTTTTN